MKNFEKKDGFTVIDGEKYYRLKATGDNKLQFKGDLTGLIHKSVKLQNDWDGYIHEDAIIHENAKIGQGVIIQANAQIGDDTVIGSYAQIGEFTIISERATICRFANIGDGVTIGVGAFIDKHIRICGRSAIGAWAVIEVSKP